MNDSERKRVQALLNSGRISEDEAEVLFAALNESETQGPDDAARLQVTPQEASEPEIPVPPTPSGVQPPLPPSALAQAARRSHQSPHSSSAVSTETPVTWVKLVGFCGDLDVRSDPSLSNPVVTGHATVERNDTGYLIRTPPDIKGADKGAGGNWLTRLHKAAGDVSVRLPAEMGLELGIAAGDGEVRGVKTLRGTFTGGDLDVLEAETVDLTVTAGDVTLKLRPRAGEGRLKATSGDVDVIFLAGSSAVITGSATCGDLDLPPGFTRSGGFATHKFEGTLGAGEARLELLLTAGDVDIRAEDV